MKASDELSSLGCSSGIVGRLRTGSLAGGFETGDGFLQVVIADCVGSAGSFAAGDALQVLTSFLQVLTSLLQVLMSFLQVLTSFLQPQTALEPETALHVADYHLHYWSGLLNQPVVSSLALLTLQQELVGIWEKLFP